MLLCILSEHHGGNFVIRVKVSKIEILEGSIQVSICEVGVQALRDIVEQRPAVREKADVTRHEYMNYG